MFYSLSFTSLPLSSSSLSRSFVADCHDSTNSALVLQPFIQHPTSWAHLASTTIIISTPEPCALSERSSPLLGRFSFPLCQSEQYKSRLAHLVRTCALRRLKTTHGVHRLPQPMQAISRAPMLPIRTRPKELSSRNAWTVSGLALGTTKTRLMPNGSYVSLLIGVSTLPQTSETNIG